MAEALNLFMRWLHISSVAVIIGGVLYARLIVLPEAGDKLAESLAARFRKLVFTAIAALLVSGIYNIVITPGHTRLYHIWLGIKLLLVSHIFAVMVLIVRPQCPRRTRLMGGVVIAGLIVILISAHLRRIF